MKKLLLFVLAVLMASFLVACKNQANPDTSTPTSPDVSASETETESESEPTFQVPTPTSEATQSENSQISLEEVIAAFKAAGIVVNLEEKPFYESINAVDSALFYMGTDSVKLYEYKDEASFEEITAIIPELEDLPRQGLVILDTANAQALEIFQQIEK